MRKTTTTVTASVTTKRSETTVVDGEERSTEETVDSRFRDGKWTTVKTSSTTKAKAGDRPGR